MSKAVTKLSRLSILGKISRLQEILTKSGNNPLVPGNADEVAALTTATQALVATNDAYIAAQQSCKEAMAARKAALETAINKANGLAGVTDAITEGDAVAILSAGFDIVAPRTPTQPLGAPINVRAETNGKPGHTIVSCDPLPGAVSYLVQKTTDPDAASGWVQIAEPTKSRVDTNGVTPGTRVWYRMAGVNALGTGPWSEPAARPVM